MQTAAYHSPPSPGAIQSVAFPALYVAGSRLDMLNADVALSGNLWRKAEMNLLEALAEYFASHGTQRSHLRSHVLDCVADTRKTRRAYNNAWSRMSGYRIAASVGRAAA